MDKKIILTHVPLYGYICGAIKELENGLYAIEDAMAVFLDPRDGRGALAPIKETNYGDSKVISNTPYIILPEENPIAQAYCAEKTGIATPPVNKIIFPGK